MTDRTCKVCRVLAERDMREYESQMVAHWKGEIGPRKGYRQLAEWFNVTLLRREMDKAGLSTLGNEAESKYERLNDEGTVAEEVRTNLRRAGLPIDDLESDFVSYGVIRKHLTECLGEEYELESGDWEQESIDRARSQAHQKISEAVQAALSKGKLTAAGEVTVSVSVDLECEETQVRVPVDRAMRRGYVSKPASTRPENASKAATEDLQTGEKQ
jgi:hypothetical protein